MKAIIEKVGEIMTVQIEGTPRELAELLNCLGMTPAKTGPGSPTWRYCSDSRDGSKDPAENKCKRRMVRWDENESRLKAQNEFTSAWHDFPEDEIDRQIVGASRWLFKHPSEMGPKNNLDLFLRNWINKELGTMR